MKNANTAAFAFSTLLALTPLATLADTGFFAGGSIGSTTLSEDFDGFGIDW